MGIQKSHMHVTKELGAYKVRNQMQYTCIRNYLQQTRSRHAVVFVNAQFTGRAGCRATEGSHVRTAIRKTVTVDGLSLALLDCQ